MSRPVQRQYFAMAEKADLERLLRQLETKTAIFFGKTTADYPYTDHGCIVERQADNLYNYTVEGHGIGSNEKAPATLKDTVSRIFADCQRFGGGDTVTIETTSRLISLRRHLDSLLMNSGQIAEPPKNL